MRDWTAASKEPWAKTLLARARCSDREIAAAEAGPHGHVDAAELLRQVCLRTRPQAEVRNVALVVHCACGSIRVQSEMFSKALFNLLDNAIEATSSGHPVFIDASHTADGDLLWQIQDTGRGMDLDMLARLGEPHAGLGVALANAIIQQHGGMLRFESAPGVGTTASVWLPADVGDMQPGSLASGLPEWVM